MRGDSHKKGIHSWKGKRWLFIKLNLFIYRSAFYLQYNVDLIALISDNENVLFPLFLNNYAPKIIFIFSKFLFIYLLGLFSLLLLYII